MNIFKFKHVSQWGCYYNPRTLVWLQIDTLVVSIEIWQMVFYYINNSLFNIFGIQPFDATTIATKVSKKCTKFNANLEDPD